MQFVIEMGSICNSNCNFQVLQGSVATQCRWGGRLCNNHIGSFVGNLSVNQFWKSVYICRSYDQKFGVLLF